MIVFSDVSPAFYKTLLFNELNKKEEVIVLYQEDPKRPYRDGDFLKGERDFKFINQRGGSWKMSMQLVRFLIKTNYDKLVVGGYDTLHSWAAVLFSPKIKNACIIESTLRETSKKGLRAIAKRLFFKRVNKVYVCGKSHADLVKAFGFKGIIIDIGTVGLIRRVPQPVYQLRQKVVNFLFVGRLTPVKNLEWLFSRFSNHLELKLTVIGSGELEEHLKSIAPTNVSFLGSIDNSVLPRYYKEADVFILPSYSETYGLVVEEALNNGTPVFVSHMVGCQDNLVVKNNVGLVFRLNDNTDFENKLKQICNTDFYNQLRMNVSKMDFEKFEVEVVESFFK